MGARLLPAQRIDGSTPIRHGSGPRAPAGRVATPRVSPRYERYERCDDEADALRDSTRDHGSASFASFCVTVSSLRRGGV